MKIACISDRDGQTDIYALQPGVSAVTRLTNDGDREQRPAWSPDGQLIAFARPCDYYSTNCGLFTIHADGTAITNVYPSGADPTWSPDGRRLAFSDGTCDYYYGCTFSLAIVKVDGTAYVTLTGSSAFQPAWRR